MENRKILKSYLEFYISATGLDIEDTEKEIKEEKNDDAKKVLEEKLAIYYNEYHELLQKYENKEYINDDKEDDYMTIHEENARISEAYSACCDI